ncbi:MAG: BrnA antitoxin family protein [Erysipelotrichaceae bacterium]|nr:BrnA antitoxin family protein [Erysipelotrichaceae bacterium]
MEEAAAEKSRKQITINLDSRVVDYFKDLAAKNGIPYQTLINLYLLDCVDTKKRPTIDWK